MNPLDELVFVKVAKYANGAIKISGHIGDPEMCIRLLRKAIERLEEETKPQPLIIIPNREVNVRDYAHPVKTLGDMPRSDWGDR